MEAEQEKDKIITENELIKKYEFSPKFCECGSYIRYKGNFEVHLKTKKHQKFIEDGIVVTRIIRKPLRTLADGSTESDPNLDRPDILIL